MRRYVELGGACLIGAIITFAAMGWWGEHRVRLAEVNGIALTLQVRDEALRLALINPIERGLAASQAVANVLRAAERHPSINDKAPLGTQRRSP